MKTDTAAIQEMSLEDICGLAMSVGRKIDLSDCPYGDTTGDCPFINRPTSYYYFLAGFVNILKLTHVLEIGTNYGGSIMSISKGLREGDISRSRLVTIDIMRKNDEGFKRYPHIKRIYGDSLQRDVVAETAASFDRAIDVLYIDSVHEYKHTKDNISIYGKRLKPKYVILDDIRQSPGMERLWVGLKEELGDKAFDASGIVIRNGAGFGVIKRRDQKDL
ncbi:MAG: class I SAM-dependent methyltransferase [Candidatus Omnitrophota bacterium]